MRGPTRDRQRPLRVVVTDAERADIEARAAKARLSVSAYLRTLGLAHTPRSMIDQDAVLELARINGDQGRLGGLLKLWLSERPSEVAGVADIRHVLHQIEDLQRRLLAIVERM